MPVVAESTHVLTFTRDRVVKQYRSWGRGEPDREWDGLGVLHHHARGLSPQPLRRHVAHGAPVIEMTRVAGEPLGAAPLSHDQVAAVARALAQMFQAVPAQTLTRLPERQSGPARAALPGAAVDAAGAAGNALADRGSAAGRPGMAQFR